MKQLLITFDHELALGKNSGSVDNCMIKPASAILDILARHNAKAIFFVDSLSLYRMKQEAGNNPMVAADLTRAQQQIKKMVTDGHYVFHHLHPHWIDAVYNKETNAWNLGEQRNYAFSSLSESDRSLYFDKSMEALNEARGVTYPGHEGFRAGGLFIQPFEIFKPSFLKHGIKYEFSALRNSKAKTVDGKAAFDFTKMPKENIYHFEDRVEENNDKGQFVEFALELAPVSGLLKIQTGIHFRLFGNRPEYQKYSDGTGTGNKLQTVPLSTRWRAQETYSVELLNYFKVFYYRDKINRDGYLHLLSHPKSVSPYNLECFDKLLGLLMGDAEVETDFRKFKY